MKVKKIRLTNLLPQLVTLYLWSVADPRERQLSILHLKRGMIAELEPWEMTQYVYNAVLANYVKMEKFE